MPRKKTPTSIIPETSTPAAPPGAAAVDPRDAEIAALRSIVGDVVARFDAVMGNPLVQQALAAHAGQSNPPPGVAPAAKPLPTIPAGSRGEYGEAWITLVHGRLFTNGRRGDAKRGEDPLARVAETTHGPGAVVCVDEPTAIRLVSGGMAKFVEAPLA